MKRLPRIFLLVGVTLVVMTALLVTALRLVLPHLNQWREPLFEQLSEVAGVSLSAGELRGEWKNFGPVLEVNNLHLTLPSQGEINVKRLSLALDVWQSLLHQRWQFRDLTFHQLSAKIDTPINSGQSDRITLTPNALSDLFLTQIDHFTLRDSEINFLTLNGERATLAIPQMMWLNDDNRHRAEGVINLSSFSGQHGGLQVGLDLADTNGYLDTGRIWMQANEVDARPWLGKWMKDNTSLESAQVSVAAWMQLRDGRVESGDVSLSNGKASWRDGKQFHQLTLEKMNVHLLNQTQGWQFDFPKINLTTDGEAWPEGQLSLLWMTEKTDARTLRLRAANFSLERLASILPLFTRLMPEAADNWQLLHPHGEVQLFAADIPVATPKESQLLLRMKNVGWQQWRDVPAMANLSGELSGSLAQGKAEIGLQNATLPYEKMFAAPLQVAQAGGKLHWIKNDKGLQLKGEQWQLQAHALAAGGDFTYTHLDGESPRLELLAGIRVKDAGEAWRYFPHDLMEPPLISFLNDAIKGGEVSNASLILAGDPGAFPFRNNQGMFEVAVPLRRATFQFQPLWPAITDLDIDLDFVNNGLAMQAKHLTLGKVAVRDVSADIPDYRQQKLFIAGDIQGDGEDIGHYFTQTPLKSTLGSALQQVQLQGPVGGKLNLTIPLHGHDVVAEGDVNLDNNQLTVKPLGTTLQQLKGRFTYKNGNLESGPLSAQWFGQPVNLRFNTEEMEQRFAVNIDLQGKWQPATIAALPFSSALSGQMEWQSHVAVDIPHAGSTKYSVTVEGDLKDVSSHLPQPLEKKAGISLPVQLKAVGNISGFTLQGKAGKKEQFNSRWSVGKQLKLEKFIWQSQTEQVPTLPNSSMAELNLPALAGDTWLALLARESTLANPGLTNVTLPSVFTLRTPELSLAGQQWHDLEVLTTQRVSGGRDIQVTGTEVRGTLAMSQRRPWQARFDYLYYNPQWAAANNLLSDKQHAVDFSQWPDLNLSCNTCWLRGQNVGRISAELSHTSDTLRVKNGVIDSGTATLTFDGEWINRGDVQRTALKGALKGKNMGTAAERYGLMTPLRDSAFDIAYDLHWQSPPWQPVISSLSGVLTSHLGPGHISDVNTGRAGQLLRLVSVDALLRKLRFDFSDTFSKDFYFDDITGTAWIEKGVIHTDNLLIDGLEADIAMKGRIDLVTGQLDMQAVVAPEISATVGVATAFAINPVVGAAVFAASKVLAPLWNKISVLRYHISGPLDKPEINEVLRKVREK